MVNEEIRKKIIEDEGYHNTLFCNNQSYDNSIIGVDDEGKLIYLYDFMVEEFIQDNYPPEVIEQEKKKDPHFDEVVESMQWIDYNTVRAIPYFSTYGITPVIIDINREYDPDNHQEDKYQYTNLINGDPYDLNKKIILKIRDYDATI